MERDGSAQQGAVLWLGGVFFSAAFEPVLPLSLSFGVVMRITVPLAIGGWRRGRGVASRPDLDQLLLQAGQRPDGQSECVIKFAHHQQAVVGTNLRTLELHLHTGGDGWRCMHGD